MATGSRAPRSRAKSLNTSVRIFTAILYVLMTLLLGGLGRDGHHDGTRERHLDQPDLDAAGRP